MNFFVENWQFFTGGLASLVLYIARDRYLDRINRKKGDVEVKKEELDYANETREYFLKREADLKQEKDELKHEFKTYRDEAKSEREYYREKQGELRTAINNIQDKFDKVALNYALEVEKSEKWMQKFFEMEKENKQVKEDNVKLREEVDLIKQNYAKLETDHELLKEEFESYKAKHK